MGDGSEPQTAFDVASDFRETNPKLPLQILEAVHFERAEFARIASA